jgi:hypothetical protein
LFIISVVWTLGPSYLRQFGIKGFVVVVVVCLVIWSKILFWGIVLIKLILQWWFYFHLFSEIGSSKLCSNRLMFSFVQSIVEFWSWKVQVSSG